ncbi:UBP-type zinc finger domain-containing protein [Streptomyces sp. NPDC002120]|uniref:UBP-type zinc finger domain-containing protein n=1 Tax=Streptomyces sp. NPDC002120 TaxID=3364631 RepID=UPI00369DA758
MTRTGSDSDGAGRPLSSWAVAPDGGRPEGRTCSHVTALPAGPGTPSQVCEQCRKRGWTWTRLRWCSTCGHVGCCDSSQGRHAYAHHARTGHPVVVSLAPDESWAWCYVDEVFLRRDEAAEPSAPR